MGGSVISWGVLGVLEYGYTPVRIAIALLNFCVGILFLIRSKELKNGSIKSILLSLPSFILSGLAFKLSPITNIWNSFSQILFIIGTAIAISAFIKLGRSFAIMPALRKIVDTGPYRIVRHPAYLGELLMVVACCIAQASLWSYGLLVILIPTIIIRINAEERILQTSPAYKDFMKKTKWRFIPGIW